MMRRALFLRMFLGFSSIVLLGACGGGSSGNNDADTPTDDPATSNAARFTLECDLQGVVAEMILNIEAVQGTGLVWGSGPNPDITGVIGTGNYLLYTSGELSSPVAHYVFSGENNFADFTETNTLERFRVEFVEQNQGLLMIVNPFGPEPAQHACAVTESVFI